MAGEAEKINVLGCHVDGQDSRRLGRVHDQLQAMSMGNGPHPADIHRVAREVGGMGADDGSGLRPDQPLKIAVVDPSLPGRSTELCSRSVEITWSPGFSSPQMAIFSASVELQVNTT